MSAENLLSIVYQKESEALRFYENLQISQPKCAIFVEIIGIRKSGLALLDENAKRLNLDETKIENQNSYIVANSIQDALILSVAKELEICAFYESILDSKIDEISLDLIFRLHATSHNEYIKALKNELFGADNFECSNPAATFLNDIKTALDGKTDPNLIKNIVNNPNFSFFSGVGVGGLLGVGVQEIIENLTKE
ncbi:MAG: hypothetical protein MR902_00315 [Campylobacter sp.]|nr:hypothetical protein [Campylobacter sp.]